MVAVAEGILAVVIVVLALNLFTVLLAFSFVRARRAQAALARAAAGPLQRGVKPGERPSGVKPVTRREFFRRSLIGSFTLFIAQFGGASIAFLWPNLKGGFGSIVNAGALTAIRASIESSNEPYYYGAGRLYIVPYAGAGRDQAADVDYAELGLLLDSGEQRYMALYQKCPHLGCRVPFCRQSQWFECPCHGSKYNRAGEYQLGPAPRGMDRFPITLDGGDVLVDTAARVLGPPRGTSTTGQSPEGPFCVGG